METRSVVRGVRLSADKGRLVADLVRGKKVDQALNILSFTNKRAAGIIKKALESAIANAEHNDGADIDDLKVKSIYVEQGATLKRFSARAKGRGNRISKGTCHIYVNKGMDNIQEISDKEEDFIDRAVNPRINSRLGCQCVVIDGDIEVTLPDQSGFLGH